MNGRLPSATSSNGETIILGPNFIITRKQLTDVVNKIIRDADTSVVKSSTTQQGTVTKKKNDKISCRICPMCDKTIGNFGTNFKNHMSACVPVRNNMTITN
jgi:hypothetical protein